MCEIINLNKEMDEKKDIKFKINNNNTKLIYKRKNHNVIYIKV